jgi:predicted AlkP superfamily pyrophosphatase or phosphodiesterase
MRRRYLLLITPILITLSAQSQKKSTPDSRPRLVVGVMVDQMRWDFLYRYYNRFQPNGGFRRLMDKGFSNEQTFIPYAPTVTACGHASVYTGSVPAVHGIVGNNWWSKAENKVVYCSEDPSVQTVGSNTTSGKMSPRNMFANSICDELKLATNFRSKVIGIAIKDRGAILPAGHTADAAYWYDNKSGNWITSTYYRESLPQWVRVFNEKKYPDQVYQQGWTTLYPMNTYVQSDSSVNDFESRPFGEDQINFPYKLDRFIGKNYGVISQTPYGNTMTFEMAKSAVVNELLGKDEDPDFLAVSFSTPDYIGHAFGPNSIEVEDAYLRMDIELAAFFNFLDQQVGSDQYVVFLTADHGVSHVPGFLQKQKHPGGNIDDDKLIKELNDVILQKFGLKDVVLSGLNYQFSLNHSVIDSSDVDRLQLLSFIQEFVKKQPGIDRVFPCSELYKELMPLQVRERFSNGYHPKRSGDIQLLFQPGWIDGGKKGTTHGLWNPYDSHIPLIWYGRGIPKGRSNNVVYMTDIAPTLAALLRIQMPNGCIGSPILPVLSEK